MSLLDKEEYLYSLNERVLCILRLTMGDATNRALTLYLSPINHLRDSPHLRPYSALKVFPAMLACLLCR